MSKKVPPPAKPVNDLIKFWASQQDETEKGKATSDSTIKSPKRPLSPNPDNSTSQSRPLSPSPSSPPISPIQSSNNVINNLTSNGSKLIGGDNGFQSTSSNTSSNPFDENNLPPVRLRDPKLSSQMVQRDSLPPVKNVSDLVSKFEKVTSPPLSPTNPSTKKNLSDIPESPQSTSPRPMSPIKRNQAIEPLTISQPLSDAISNTLIKQRDITPLDLSIDSTIMQKQSDPLYSPVKTPTSIKRRSNIPDPIVIPIQETSTTSIKDPKKTKSPISPISDISSSIRSMVSPTRLQKFKITSPKFKPILSKRHTTENLPQIRPTSSFDIDSMIDQTSKQDFTEEELLTLKKQQKQPKQQKQQKQRRHVSESKLGSSPKSPVSPKGSQKRSISNLPNPPHFSLSSGQETIVEVSEYPSSPPIQSPNSGFSPVSSVPTSPEFSSSNTLEFLPEITPISPFWNPAAPTGSNAVSPLWKPSPENQKKLISPILMPKKIISALDNVISGNKNKKSKKKNNDDGIPTNKPRDLWFKRSSSSFLKVPEKSSHPIPTSSPFTMQEPLPKKSTDGSDPTANSYIFSFLSEGDMDSWKFIAGSPNGSSTNLKLDLNPFSSYLDNIKEDTDVENEDQNYNPFVDGEQPDMEEEKKRKYAEIANSHSIEMQVTNMVHSRSTTKVDENDTMEVDGYNGLKKSKSTGSLDSVRKSKQKRHHSQQKYKPVQIPKSPYSEARPQRNTLSPEFILKDKQNLLRNITVSNFTTITEDEKENVQGNISDTSESVNYPKFTIDPFDEFEKNELFLPGTPLIHLPHLDEHIKSLPKTEFSKPKEVMTSEEYEKFLTQGNFHNNPENLFPLISQSIDDDQSDKRSMVSTIQIKDKDDGPTERGITGSSRSPFSGKCQDSVSILYEQRFLRLEIIRDFIQFMTIALSFITEGMFDNNKIYVILSSVPNFLSFNMDKVFGSGAVFFLIFSIIGLIGLFMFRKMANWKKVTDVENLKSPSRTSLLQNHILIFILTTLYVPLTRLSLNALVWSDSFWPIKNPYLPNVDFPDFDSMIDLGDGTLRNPKDFCYVTSMKKDVLNFSPFIIALGLLNLCVFTFWFPIKLKRIVNTHIGKFGLTGNDDYAHKFLYDGYSENWATYKSFIMGMKSFLIFFTVVISKDNCLFRSSTRQHISTAAQVLEIILFVLLLLPYWKSKPFIYSNFNTAECWARIGYLIASFIGLFIVLHVGSVQGSGIVLFIINIVILVGIIWYLFKEINDFGMRYTNGGNAYGLSRSISRSVSNGRSFGNKKLEFSLDISSPDMDFDKLIKERIWQDTWIKLLLLNDNFKPPAGKTLLFNEESYLTPYLINFNGTVGERHIENSKIFSAIGLRRYVQSLTILSSSIKSKILNNYVGVDMYYSTEFPDDSRTWFGKTYVIPFPFTVVMRYDEDDSIVVLTQEWEIQMYLQQNENEEIQRRRSTRQMIRALEGKNVIGPCHEVDCMKNKAHHHRGVLSIQRKKGPFWREYDLNPGFEVTITYSDSNQVVEHDVIGITNDFKMTHKLERLFGDNYELIEVGLDQVKTTMDEYRRYYRNESRSKEEILTYGFHINIFNNPSIPLETLPSLLINTEENQHIRSIPEREYPTMVYLYERMRIVHTSRVHQWWYLFWEDLWKNNGQRISYLRKYEQDFSPLYRTSICYQPMKRSDLEGFMEKRGLWMNEGKSGLFHSGVLNRIYLYLNGIVFGRKGRDGSAKKWYISKDDDKIQDQNLLGSKGFGIMKNVVSGINRNSHRPFYTMREESDSDFEDVELDATNNNNVSDDETLCY